MKCNNCGIENPSDARFCRGCGKNLSRKSSKWYLLLGSVFVLFAIYFIVGYINRGDGADVIINNDKAVDLGLSVKWASCNLGASSAEEYGDYCGYSNSHFNGTTSYTYPLNNNVSGSNEDYVRQRLGAPWRLPTMNEFQELIDKCDWQWTIKSGKKGYIITGPNGNSIFLPAAGIYDAEDSGWGDEGKRGYYQTGTIINNEYMYALYFWESGVKIGDGMSCVNNAFRSVRPVFN